MDKRKSVEEALREVLAVVQEADARDMVGHRPKPKVEIEAEGEEGGPEHESEEMELIRSLEGLHEDDDDKDGPSTMRRAY